MLLPDGERPLLELAQKLVERCNVSRASRAQQARFYAGWRQNGTQERQRATANLLYGHVEKVGSHLMSPSELRFVIDTEQDHPKETQQICAVAARVLTREWERQNIDVLFAQGVTEALAYGAVIPKLLVRDDGEEAHHKISIAARLVMPWNFGVLNETVNSLSEQEAMCETAYLTRYEVWRRVRFLPDGQKLYERIIANAIPDPGVGGPDGFMHEVLLGATTAPVNPSAPMQAPGLVDVGGDSFPNPQIAVAEDLYPFYELWVKNDKTEDWTTIQYIAPDILISPRNGIRRANLFCPNTLPYGRICANETPMSFWGRSELEDLIEPQKLMTGILEDYRKLMAVQFDKFIAFSGQDGISDEMAYRQARKSGFANLGPNASAVDLTPKIPPEALPFIEFIRGIMPEISGFSPIMSGQGEPGVRAGVHADTLLRTSSPFLRDRSLLVERQLAQFADSSLAAYEAKEAQVYWVDPNDGGKTDFRMNQLPDDRRVSVDAHSSSPIYHDDMTNLMTYGHRAGYITPQSMIEFLPYQNKEMLLQRLKDQQEAQKALLEKLGPEDFARLMGHGRHR